VTKLGDTGVIGAAAAPEEATGETESLHAVARSRPILKNQGSKRERDMVCFSYEGIVIDSSGFTVRYEITGDPWPDCRRDRSLTVFLS